MSSLPEPIDPVAAAQITAATGGNPLALIDLAGELTARQLTESSFADEPLPVGHHLEAFYLRRVRHLHPDVQAWLLVAAADSTGNLDLIAAATEELGVPGSPAEAAEAAGLVELATRVRFRHPLVRSAAYNAAQGGQRRRVHAALSVAASRLGLVELEAWHAAKATLGTDPAVADRLETRGRPGRPARWALLARHRARAGRGADAARPAEVRPPGRGRRGGAGRRGPPSWPRACSTTSTRTPSTRCPAAGSSRRGPAWRSSRRTRP